MDLKIYIRYISEVDICSCSIYIWIELTFMYHEHYIPSFDAREVTKNVPNKPNFQGKYMALYLKQTFSYAGL